MRTRFSCISVEHVSKPSWQLKKLSYYRPDAACNDVLQLALDFPAKLIFLAAMMLVAIMLVTLASSVAFAQSDDEDVEEDEISPFAVGIVVERDSEVSLANKVFLSETESMSPTKWSGFLQSDGNGTYRIAAAFHGKLEVRINGAAVLKADSTKSPFAASEPFQLDFDQHAFHVELQPLGDDHGDHSSVRLFWAGPGFPLEPIPANSLLHRRVEGVAPRSTHGPELVRVLRCEACHTLNGPQARDPLRSPSLASATEHIREEWLINYFRKPTSDKATSDKATKENSNERARVGRLDQIHQQFSESDAAHLVAWLRKQSGEPKQNDEPKRKAGQTKADAKANAGNTASGHELLHTVGCLACHTYDGLGATSNLFGGGDLTHMRDKRDEASIENWLRNPASVNKNHRMPNFDLSDGEVSDLVALFTNETDSEAAGDTDRQPDIRDVAEGDSAGDSAGDTAIGERIAAKHRCLSCHQVDGRKSPYGKTKIGTASDLSRSCLTQSGDGRPAYRSLEWLTDKDKLSVAESITHASRQSTPLLAENSCLQCHARGESLGLAPTTEAVVAKHDGLASKAAKMKPPALNSVGDKLLDNSLRDSISRKDKPHRPWLAVRMPRFPLDKEEVERLATHFVAQDRVPNQLHELCEIEIESVARENGREARRSEAYEVAIGERLVTSDGFGCTSCHAIGKVKPPSTTPANQLGPSLSMPSGRLRKAWFDRWVRNPARITPKMEMPSVQIPVPGVLDEDLDRQLNAVWNVLNVHRFSPPDASPTRIVHRSGEQDEPAVVLTDVIRVHGEKLIKPFLIGLPNRRNVLFDFEHGNLAAIWSGDTARQRTQGKTWFWEPPVNQIQHASKEPDFALFNDARVASVRRGQFMTEPDEWRRIENGIEFRHRVYFPNSESTEPRTLHVTQRIVAIENGFHRTISIAGLEAAESIGVSSRLGAESKGNVDVVSAKDGYFVTRSDKEGSAEFQLSYSSEETNAYRPSNRPVVISKLKELAVMPGFTVKQLPLRSDIMPISLAWKPDGKLLVGSLKGRVWLAQDSDGDEFEDVIQPISDDLAAPYGLHATEKYIDVLSKYGLVRLHLNEDDDVLRHEMVASGWGHTDDYHDWVVGLPMDKRGNYYVSIPCQQDDRSQEAAHLRGTVLRLAPRNADEQNPRRYDLQTLSAGHRFPMGIAMNRREQLFVTDNQGNYNPYNELNHVVPGSHFGFINKLQRKDESQPPLTEPAIDIPHPWTRSVNGICFLDSPAGRESVFGPFEGHLVGCEYDTRRLIRMTLEEVGGQLQGAAYPLAEADMESGESLQGPVSCRVAPDGDLYVANIRDSGWGGANNTGSVVRIVPQLEKLPAGIRDVTARSDGFVIRFTKPVDVSLAEEIENYSVSSVRRISTPIYGGDDVERRRESVKRVTCSNDGLFVKLEFTKLRAGFVYEFRLRKLLANDAAFFPSEAFYTLRKIPAKND